MLTARQMREAAERRQGKRPLPPSIPEGASAVSLSNSPLDTPSTLSPNETQPAEVPSAVSLPEASSPKDESYQRDEFSQKDESSQKNESRQKKDFFPEAVSATLHLEGGYVVDSGGPTNWGISQKAHPSLSVEQLKAMTREQAIEIYRQDYWIPCGAAQLVHKVVALELFDTAVNCGQKAAVRFLQQAFNLLFTGHAGNRTELLEDGRIGPATIVSVNSLNYTEALALAVAQNGFQFGYYVALAENEPERFARYIRGWMKRVQFYGAD